MEPKERIINPGSNLSPYLRQLSVASPRKVLLVGRGAVHTTAVRFAATAALADMPVLVIDGANAFDPYEVARVARRRRRDPEKTLKSIQLARAFTCYQLRELVFRLEARLDRQQPLAVIMGLCSTFFDDDVPLNEAAALFYQTWWKLTDLHARGWPLLVAQSASPVNLRQRYFLEDLYRLSDLVLRVESGIRRRRKMDHSAEPSSVELFSGRDLLTAVEG